MAPSPARIGPYELVSRLGIGGMAETYLAVRRGPGAFEQRVCLKLVRDDRQDDPEFVRQFMAEAAIAAKLRHATIAQVLDFGCEEGTYYLALELVDGLDLRAALEHVGTGLPVELALYIAIELATALDFAHRAGGSVGDAPVVHRDVSASNALISMEGEVKLADFGIARSLSGPQHTQTGIVKGKVPYLAPEYARSGRFDQRCDLFSLGVLLYETLSGERPHDGATDLETLERAGSGRRRHVSERVPALPPAFAEIVEQLLEHDPALRFQSAAALLEALLCLPAPGRARRELGVLVASIRRDQRAAADARNREAAMVATAPAAEGDVARPTATSQLVDRAAARTRTQRSVSAGGAGAAPESEAAMVASLGARRVLRGPWIALTVAIAFACGVLALALTRSAPAGAVTRSTQPAPSASAAAAPAPAADPSGTQPTASSAPTPTNAPEGSDILARPTADGPHAPAEAPDAKAAAKLAGQLEVIVLPYGEVIVDGKPFGRAPVTLSLAPGPHTVIGKHHDGSFRKQISLAPGEHRQLVLR